MSPLNPRRTSWPQALISCVAIAASATVYALVPDSREIIGVVFGAAVTAAMGALKK